MTLTAFTCIPKTPGAPSIPPTQVGWKRAEGLAEQEIARLQYLEKLGLARRIDERSWELSAEHEPELRRRQREHDILKSRARERQRERGLDREPEIER